LQRIADEITADGGHAVVIDADLCEHAAATRVVEAVVDQLGGLDILVNAAGVARYSPVVDGDPVDWREMWEVNVLALAQVSREAVSRFPAEGGHVVHLGSLSGHRVPPGGGFYAATKFAVRAHAEALRCELRAGGSRTRVSCVSPGFVATPLAEEYLRGAGKTLAELGYEALDPADVARCVLHAIESPPGVEINDVLVRPAGQPT
jgi:NADP-dependent 3-hydroxy acid dehydrogenase YdfG